MNSVEIISYLDLFPLKLLNTLAASYQETELLSPDDVYELKQDLDYKKERIATFRFD